MNYLKLLLGFASLLICQFIGPYWARNAEGYKQGNRFRIVSVLKIEIIMTMVSVFTYNQLMAWFDDPYIQKGNFMRMQEHKTRKRYVSMVLIMLFVLAQLMHPLYYTPSMFSSVFMDLTAIAGGIYSNLVAFVVGFACVNLAVRFCAALWTRPEIRQYLYQIERLVNSVMEIRIIRALVTNRRCQIKCSVFLALFISAVTWLFCDNVVVSERTIFIQNYTGDKELNIAFISDIHAGATVRRPQIEKIVDTILTLDIDLVVIVGDLVDGPRKHVQTVVEPLFVLPNRFPTYFVTGNHDYYYGDVSEWLSLLKSRRITVLNNQAQMFRNVCLAGVSDISSLKSGIHDQFMNISSALAECAPHHSKILLAHNPVSVLSMTQTDLSLVDLILSGHTHAGQFYTAIPVVYFLVPYFYGVYELPAPSHGKLFVSSGVLYQGPPMKMLGFSEVVRIQVRGL